MAKEEEAKHNMSTATVINELHRWKFLRLVVITYVWGYTYKMWASFAQIFTIIEEVVSDLCSGWIHRNGSI
jgi:hypothetical protein